MFISKITTLMKKTHLLWVLASGGKLAPLEISLARALYMLTRGTGLTKTRVLGAKVIFYFHTCFG